MYKDFKELITELIKEEKGPDNGRYQTILDEYCSAENVEEFIDYYEHHEILDADRASGLSERTRLRKFIHLMIKSQLHRQDGSTLLKWALTFGDAWKALIYDDLLSTAEGNELFNEDQSNVLHLFFAREDIDFTQDFYLIKELIQTNIGLFLKPSANDLTPYDVLKQNRTIAESSLNNLYSLPAIFESRDDLIGSVYVGQWQKRWEKFLMIASDEMIQFVLNQGVALSVDENGQHYCLYGELDHSSSLAELTQLFKKIHEEGDKDHEFSPQCNKMVEQSLIYMANLLGNEGIDKQERNKRFTHVQDALMKDYFKKEKAMDHLKDRLNIILNENPDINQENLKKVVGCLESRFGKKYEDISEALRKKAIISSILTVLLIGIPFAIYYWAQYKKSCKAAPVHVFHMPVSTYKKIIRYLDRDYHHVAEKVMSEKGNIKRAVEFLGQFQAAFFESKDADNKTMLKVVCTAGVQTDNFQEKLDELSFVDRFSVKQVL